MAKLEIRRMVMDAFACQRSINRELYIREQTSMSLVYPGGVVAYCDTEIFNLISQIKEQSALGHVWVINGTGEIESNEGYDFIIKFCTVETKKLQNPKPYFNYPADHPKGDLKEFLTTIFDLKALQDIKSKFIENEERNIKGSTNLKPVIGGLHSRNLDQRIVALICFYNAKPIRKDNFIIIANDFGIEASERLANNYKHCKDEDRRLIPGGTRTQIKNQITRVKVAMTYLSDTAKILANKDLQILESDFRATN